MLTLERPLQTPGLLVIGTDTDVGKTVVSCGIAAALLGQTRGPVAVCKPMASGCRRTREGLVSEDAEALAHFADCRLPLDIINPIRFRPPVAPAVAAELANEPVPWHQLAAALRRLDTYGRAIVIEGVGGLLVPLDPTNRSTILDLAVALGLPAVIVARAGLGTLNHTAMTAALLRQARVPCVGVVVNGYDADATAHVDDPSMPTNARWIQRMTGLPVLTQVPRLHPDRARPEQAVLDDAILDTLAEVPWSRLIARPALPSQAN